MELFLEAVQVSALALIAGIGVALVLGTIALIVSGARALEEGIPEQAEPEVGRAFDFQLCDPPRAESDLGDVSERRAA